MFVKNYNILDKKIKNGQAKWQVCNVYAIRKPYLLSNDKRKVSNFFTKKFLEISKTATATIHKLLKMK